MGAQRGSCPLAVWNGAVEERVLRSEEGLLGQEGHPKKEAS